MRKKITRCYLLLIIGLLLIGVFEANTFAVEDIGGGSKSPAHDIGSGSKSPPHDIGSVSKSPAQDIGSPQEETAQDLRPADYPKSDILLKGGISNTDELPPGPGGGEKLNATLRQTLRNMNDALDPVAGPLQNLSNVLDAIAPHYDMVSHNDTGLRVIQDIMKDAALGHLIGNAPKALRGMVARSDRAIDTARRAATRTSRAKGWGKSAQNHNSGRNAVGNQSTQVLGRGTRVAPGHPNYLPPTLRVPEMLQKTPRPIYLQEESHSCVQACTRMVAHTIKRAHLPEETIRKITGKAYTPGVGTQPEAISKLLGDVGIPNSKLQKVSIDELAKGTEGGYPAIVSYGDKHASIVDAVVEHGGERFVFMRNPVNPAHLSSKSSQFVHNAGHENFPILREEDFLRSFIDGGSQAIFTNPASF